MTFCTLLALLASQLRSRQWLVSLSVSLFPCGAAQWLRLLPDAVGMLDTSFHPQITSGLQHLHVCPLLSSLQSRKDGLLLNSFKIPRSLNTASALWLKWKGLNVDVRVRFTNWHRSPTLEVVKNTHFTLFLFNLVSSFHFSYPISKREDVRSRNQIYFSIQPQFFQNWPKKCGYHGASPVPWPGWPYVSGSLLPPSTGATLPAAQLQSLEEIPRGSGMSSRGGEWRPCLMAAGTGVWLLVPAKPSFAPLHLHLWIESAVGECSRLPRPHGSSALGFS